MTNLLPNYDKQWKRQPEFWLRLRRFQNGRTLSSFLPDHRLPQGRGDLIATAPGYRNSGIARAAALAAALIMLAIAGPARAQVAPTASAGGFGLSAGVTGTGEYVQYGERKMVGVAPFFDFDTIHRLGLEGEARFVQWRQTSDVHFSSYSGGVRYRFNVGKFQPYAKGLVGMGYFNFPYNYATGHYMVVTAGGGLDYRFKESRIHFRLADAEWQYWPGFTYGAMSTLGVSAGVRFTIP
jgi:hypothetical protein